VQPIDLRPATSAQSCGTCLMYRSLDDYKGMVSQFGAQSLLVLAYGYGPQYLTSDGICEVSGDPPVQKSQVCNNYIAA
jgi:hypothetical protein